MTGNEVVVDSNIIIDIMKGDAHVAARFQAFHIPCITPVILSELYFGAYRSANPSKNIAKIRMATQRCRILVMNESTADSFVAIKLALQAKDKPIPENDIWIAASAIQYQFAVYTNDAHFSNIDDLQLV